MVHKLSQKIHGNIVFHYQIAEMEGQLERLLHLGQQQELLDPEEFSLSLDEAGFDSPEVSLLCTKIVRGVTLFLLFRPCSRLFSRSSPAWRVSRRN